jgi:hypothetical protein
MGQSTVRSIKIQILRSFDHIVLRINFGIHTQVSNMDIDYIKRWSL